MKTILVLVLVVLLFGCGNPEPVVKSPFSHLDTVTIKKQDAKEEENSGGVKSPFSGLDKK